MLELQRRRFVRDRTQAIQRLRSDWTQVDPVAEASVAPLRPPARAAQAQAHHARRRPRRAHRRRAASASSRATSKTSTTASPTSTPRSPTLLDRARQPARPTCSAPATRSPPRSSPNAGDVRRFKNAAAFARFCGAAPIPCGSGQTAGRHRLHRGGNRQLNAALYRIAIVQQRHHPAAKAFLARKIRRRQDPPRSPPRAQAPPRQRPLPPPPRLGQHHPRHEPLDIGESSASSAPCSPSWAYGRATATQPPAPQRCPLAQPLQTTRNHSSLANRPPITRVRNQPRHDS